MADTDDELTLAHYGVKGMKWGVRRDGSSGSKSKKQYKDSADHTKVQKLRQRPKRSLSNDQLKTIQKRLELEASVSRLSPSKMKRGENKVKEIVATVGVVSSVIALANSPAGKAAIAAGKVALNKYKT